MSNRNRSSTPVHRPPRTGSALTVILALGTAGLVVRTPAQLVPLLVEVVGLILLAIGIVAVNRGYRILGAGGMSLGVLVAIASVGVSVVFPGSIYLRAILTLGTLGVAIVLFGVLPVRTGWARQLLTLGAVLLFASVILSGVAIEGASLRLVGAVVALTLAWDIGEQAISLGEQVGRYAHSTGVELVHGTGSAAIGTVSAGTAIVVYQIGVPAIPPVSLGLLLGAVLVLMIVVGLYQRF